MVKVYSAHKRPSYSEENGNSAAGGEEKKINKPSTKWNSKRTYSWWNVRKTEIPCGDERIRAHCPDDAGKERTGKDDGRARGPG